jgi:hypothetical protein
MTLAVLAFGLAAFTPAQNVSEEKDQEPNTAQASASPASLDFGNQEVKTMSRQLRITLTNKTDKPIEIRGVDTVEGQWEDFEADDDDCTGVPIEPGKSCSIGIIFSPFGVGNRSAFLLITYDDPDHPQKIALRGNGIKPNSGARR